jgi:cephalosporin-C deacetylase
MDEGPENLYYRSVFLDVAEAAKIFGDMPGVDPNKLYAMGGSQGGGFDLSLHGLGPNTCTAPWFTTLILCNYRKAYALGADDNGYDQLSYWFRYRDPLA